MIRLPPNKALELTGRRPEACDAPQPAGRPARGDPAGGRPVGPWYIHARPAAQCRVRWAATTTGEPLRKGLIAAALFLAAATTCAVIVRLLPDEEVTSEYPDLDAAVRDDAIKRGWLPPFTPSSAIDIRIWADLDINWFAIWFRIPLAEAPLFVQALRDNGFTPFTSSAPREPMVFSTWRASDGISPPPATASVFEGVHHAGGKRVFVVVDPSGLVYYWHR